eukprot:TRINITY_DN9205_c0_g1_i14.p1 TRINITY_DN9205_c0_g1~~TRINITY_DN9205_c0_g1_i14.p1  ORF type:complete len:538 (-),score=123.38 TRINITY_DN9205_c0_g1_i14:15-1628(-)
MLIRNNKLMTEQMEVKGVGQAIFKHEPDKAQFEKVFMESKCEIDEARPGLVSLKPAYEIPTSAELENNPLFSTLIEWMKEFHKEIHEKELREEEGVYLTMILYKRLNKLMREIVITKDSAVQEDYIKRVHDWFSKRKSEAKPKIRKEIGVSSTWKNEEPKKPLPMDPNKTLYAENRRIAHPEISPPKDRLAVFSVKELTSKNEQEQYDQDTEKQETAATFLPSLPATAKKPIREYKKANGIEGQSHFQYYKPRYVEEQKVERLWFAKKNKDVARKRTEAETRKTVTEWGLARSRFNENLVRKHEAKNFANNFRVRRMETKPVRAKTVDKNAEVDYTKVYDESSGDEETENRKYEKGKRKAPEVVDVSKPEAKSVSKSVAMGKKKNLDPEKKPLRTVKKVKNLVPRVSTAITDSGKKRVDYIRKMYGHLIGASNDSMDSAANIFVNGPKGINSLSIYNKDVRRPYTVNSSMIGSSVPVTHQGEREEIRMSQIKEIDGIKKYLARKEVACNATTLQLSLIHICRCRRYAVCRSRWSPYH